MMDWEKCVAEKTIKKADPDKERARMFDKILPKTES